MPSFPLNAAHLLRVSSVFHQNERWLLSPGHESLSHGRVQLCWISPLQVQIWSWWMELDAQ